MAAGTTTFQHIAVSRSSSDTGLTTQSRTNARNADVGRQIVGRGVGEVVEESRADQRAEGRLAADRTLDEVDRRDLVLAVART